MKYIIAIAIVLFPMFIQAQSCGYTLIDTAFNNSATLITATTARLNSDVSNGDVAGTTVTVRYVRVGFTDTVVSTTPWPTSLRNLTGLQSGTQYVYYYTFNCLSQVLRQIGRYYFTTLTAQVVYTTERSTVFPYVKGDTGFVVPRQDTALYRQPSTTGGNIVFNPADSVFYGYNKLRWVPLMNSSSGISNKVDSVTVNSDSLFYWINGVAYGYILPYTAPPISSLTAATGSNTINNGVHQQTWQWNTLADLYGLRLTSANTTAATGQTIFDVALSGANANSGVTSYGAQISNNHTGTSSTNIGLSVTAGNGTNNYALQVIDGTQGSGKVLTSDAGGKASWATPSTVATAVPINGLTGATAGNDINNANFLQIWRWNSLGSNYGLLLASNSTGASSNSQKLFSAQLTGANATSTQTTFTGEFINSHTGTSSTNIALRVAASGGTNNYGLQIVDGTQGASKVLTSDANGNASWATPSSFALTNGSGTTANGTAVDLGGTQTGNVTISQGTNTFSVLGFDGGGVGLRLRPATGISTLGDFNGSGNSNIFNVDDASSVAYYDNTAHTGKFFVNQTTGTISSGIEATGQIVNTGLIGLGSAGKSGIGTPTDVITNIGDWNGNGNGTQMQIDDGAQTIIISATSGVTISGTPITISDLSGTGTRAVLADASGVLSTMAGGLVGSTYTPTLTGVTNVTSSTAANCQYTRVGNIVTVFGSLAIVTTLAVATEVDISLPVASNLAAATDGNGTANASSAIGTNGYIDADATNDRVRLKFIGLSVGGSGNLYFSFSYTVL